MHVSLTSSCACLCVCVCVSGCRDNKNVARVARGTRWIFYIGDRPLARKWKPLSDVLPRCVHRVFFIPVFLSFSSFALVTAMNSSTFPREKTRQRKRDTHGGLTIACNRTKTTLQWPNIPELLRWTLIIMIIASLLGLWLKIYANVANKDSSSYLFSLYTITRYILDQPPLPPGIVQVFQRYTNQSCNPVKLCRWSCWIFFFKKTDENSVENYFDF